LSNFNSNTDSIQGNKDEQENTKSKATEVADVVSSLIDRLTGKEAVITYEFDNLVIDIPKAAGPGGKDLGSAKWTINGRLIIKAEAHSQNKY
jgi:hypothetical protein